MDPDDESGKMNQDEEAGATAVTTDQPTSDGSLIAKIRESKQTSGNFCVFLSTIVAILLGTIGCTLCTGLLLSIPVACIVMGSMHLDHCSVEKMIPIYLIVFGVFSLLKLLANFSKKIKYHGEKSEQAPQESKLEHLISCFLFVWFIAGNVWVYKNYIPEQKDCDTKLYLFAFWLITAKYIIICVILTCILCGAFCAICCS